MTESFIGIVHDTDANSIAVAVLDMARKHIQIEIFNFDKIPIVDLDHVLSAPDSFQLMGFDEESTKDLSKLRKFLESAIPDPKKTRVAVDPFGRVYDTYLWSQREPVQPQLEIDDALSRVLMYLTMAGYCTCHYIITGDGKVVLLGEPRGKRNQYCHLMQKT